MNLSFRFAVVSDLHIALPHTVWDHPSRFHLVEVSIPVLEAIFDHLESLNLDFLLLPGDLTQHGEPENHRWLANRLSQLPFPVYVVPGNHDVPSLLATEQTIGLADFPSYYHKFGYDNNPKHLYYACPLLPGVQLIGLNSNQFDSSGKQRGYLDQAQLSWLNRVLAEVKDQLVLVMIHHNIVEHLPGQSRHPLGRRYMLENASTLVRMLQEARVQLVFTGHLHVQDIAYRKGVYDITTGSLVSYPHPYRILTCRTDHQGQYTLQIESPRVESVPGWPTLLQTSREWMGDRSAPFMMRLLSHSPFNLPEAEAAALVPDLRYFWANIANGDASFSFPHFPLKIRRHFENFNSGINSQHLNIGDNTTTLILKHRALSNQLALDC
ncbi:metallophosphoesterase [Leptolyngbya sp. 'hensonii']|uniref:metallophosphoesterase family protein n=1 Tax=Leptolyngbya sp. 'hensonii' TaxID=1922337 RepID=UPI00094F7610|nr:metallophosphoesterase [Leptolyngbya sp. 'hensonii']OLP18854.1 metallophosphoesterase [Leptolyngbya sp. 'hensonii']